MKLVAPRAFSHVTPLGRPVAAGEDVDVDDDLADQLVAQGWEARRPRKSTAPVVAPNEE